MLDIKFIRENADKIKIAAQQKHIDLNLNRLLDLDKERSSLQKELESVQQDRNKNAESLKNVKGKPDDTVIQKGRELKDKIAEIEQKLALTEQEYFELMVKVPTIPSADTPIGKDESENVEVEKWGEIPDFKFQPKDHLELGKLLDVLDTERGTKVAGYRGYFVKNEGVELMLAFTLYAMQKLISKGFTPVIPPTLVKEFALFGSGYFKGKEYNPDTDEIYQVASHDKDSTGEKSKEKKFLVGTAEPSLLAYYANETLKEEDLPIKFVGFSQCYRSEIGSYGKDTKGIYRVHEFMKVEQVVLCKADIEESDQLQKMMVAITKEVWEDLEIPHRVIQICTGDMSAGKYKMFDIEAWMPSRNGYGEVGSASNFLDWQARRLNVRYTAKDGTKKHVFMLNNTVIPTPRPFIAILENYQQKDGSVKVPKVLQPFMMNKKVILPK